VIRCALDAKLGTHARARMAAMHLHTNCLAPRAHALYNIYITRRVTRIARDGKSSVYMIVDRPWGLGRRG
jgi:hypothetical protein